MIQVNLPRIATLNIIEMRKRQTKLRPKPGSMLSSGKISSPPKNKAQGPRVRKGILPDKILDKSQLL